MTQWRVSQGDILDTDADGLICSANPSLNLSGGVGGAFLLRYGLSMQEFLHEYLRSSQRRFVEPGEAVLAPPCGSRFKAVTHAVAIDALYETNDVWIRAAYESAFRQLAAASCKSIAAACLGCGYGKYPVERFIESIRLLAANSIAGVEVVTLVTTNSDLAGALSKIVEAAGGAEENG
ncbi:MAG: macro domain-containing protein [Pirellulaceae bacterium]